MNRYLAAAAVICFLAYAGTFFRPHSPAQVSVEAHGRIVDRESGKPVSEAWIILALQHGGPAFHGSSGGCATGSAVVRSDDTGRFSYSTLLPPIKRGERRDFNVYAYEPSYATDLWISNPKYVQVPLADVASQTSVAAALLPYRQDGGKGADLYAMTRRKTSEWEDLLNLSKIWTRACLDSSDDRGQSDLLRTLYLRAWEIHCLESSSTANADFPMNSLFKYFEIALEKIAEHMGLGYDGRSKDYGSARRFYVVNSLFPDMPEFGSMKYQPPVTADQVKRFCDFYSQPIPDLIKKEFIVEKEFIAP